MCRKTCSEILIEDFDMALDIGFPRGRLNLSKINLLLEESDARSINGGRWPYIPMCKAMNDILPREWKSDCKTIITKIAQVNAAHNL